MIWCQYFTASITTSNIDTDSGVEHFAVKKAGLEVKFNLSRTQSNFYTYINNVCYIIANFCQSS